MSGAVRFSNPLDANRTARTLIASLAVLLAVMCP
jgi:hypothetical protein